MKRHDDGLPPDKKLELAANRDIPDFFYLAGGLTIVEDNLDKARRPGA
jgi:hypothetical protein